MVVIGVALEVAADITARSGMGEAVLEALTVPGEMTVPLAVVFFIAFEVPVSATRVGMGEAVFYAKIVPVAGTARPFVVVVAVAVEMSGVSAIPGVMVALALEVGGIGAVAGGMVKEWIAGKYACIAFGMIIGPMNFPQRIQNPANYIIQPIPARHRKTPRAILAFYKTTYIRIRNLGRAWPLDMVSGVRVWGGT